MVSSAMSPASLSSPGGAAGAGSSPVACGAIRCGVLAQDTHREQLWQLLTHLRFPVSDLEPFIASYSLLL